MKLDVDATASAPGFAFFAMLEGALQSKAAF
jgi:hypothetical protein